MKISKSYYVIILFFFISFFCPPTYAVEGYTPEQINQDKNLLKQISLKVINTQENITRAQNELRMKHSEEAYDLWTKYNKANLPTVEELKKLKSEGKLKLKDVTGGKPIDGKLRQFLKNLVGKEEQTLFSAQAINNIRGRITEAVNSVNDAGINLMPNLMTGEPSIEIKYTFPAPFAWVARKEENAPSPVLIDKNEIVIVLSVGNYIKALGLSKNGLDEPNLGGKITSIY